MNRRTYAPLKASSSTFNPMSREWMSITEKWLVPSRALQLLRHARVFSTSGISFALAITLSFDFFQAKQPSAILDIDPSRTLVWARKKENINRRLFQHEWNRTGSLSGRTQSLETRPSVWVLCAPNKQGGWQLGHYEMGGWYPWKGRNRLGKRSFQGFNGIQWRLSIQATKV